MIVTDGWPKLRAGGAGVIETRLSVKDALGGARVFSARSMRGKVEKRMRQESGKTLREVRRAKKLINKLMTDEERLIHDLRRVSGVVFCLLIWSFVLLLVDSYAFDTGPLDYVSI